VTKIWDDNNNADHSRPETITLKLYNQAEYLLNPTGATPVKTAEISSSTQIYVFSDLLERDANGAVISYMVVEELAADSPYTPSLTGSQESGFVLTNTKQPDVIDIPFTKVWVDEGNAYRTRPARIQMDLLDGGDHLILQRLVAPVRFN
jgi:hypothetical protein